MGSTLGLDIGSHSIKCVELVRSKDKVMLNQAALIPLGDQSPDNLTAILKPLSDLLQRSKDHVRIVLSGSSLLVRCIQLPVMTQQELKSAIRFEAENHIAFPIDDCILDFQIVNQNAEKKIMNVLLVAAKRDFIQEKLRMLMDLDVHPEAIDVDTFSLLNAFEALASETANPDEKTKALLNIGHRVTSFAILHEKRPLFVRDIPLGGTGITRVISEAKGLSEVDAGVFKEETRPELLDEIRNYIQKGLEPLTDELKRSMEYFENEYQSPVQSVYLSGGGSLGPGAVDFIGVSLAKKVLTWDISKKIEVASGAEGKLFVENKTLFNIALGLALRN